MKIKSEHIDRLKIVVEQKFNKNIRYSKDCQELSDAVFEQTNRRISSSTLKRVWNLVNTSFVPSKYTIDSLSIYAGFESWENFLGTDSKKLFSYSDDITWDKIKSIANTLNEYSFHTIKNRLGLPFEKCISRKFAEERFTNFILSDKTAMAFIAPGGYGKSTLLAKLAEKYFFNNLGLCKNDILWMIDCSIPDALQAKNFNLETFFVQLLGYGPSVSIRKIFEQIPEKRKGRMIFMLDGIEELFNLPEKFSVFISNLLKIISTNFRTPWFKIILCCRTLTWTFIIKKMENFPQLKSKWYGVNFSGNFNELNNIPVFDSEEINNVLTNGVFANKNQISHVTISDLSDIINIPFFLTIYSILIKEKTEITDLDLLSNYLNKYIIAHKSKNKYNHFINKLLILTNFGKTSPVVNYEQISSLQKNEQDIYFDLLSIGFLYEFEVDGKYMDYQKYVSFSQKLMFEFILANYWLRNNSFTPDIFDKIHEFYKDNLALKVSLFKWIIKYAFKEEKIEVLKNIFSKINQFCLTPEKSVQSMEAQVLIQEIGSLLRRNSAIRKILLPHYASIEPGRQLFFESFRDIDFSVIYYSEFMDLYLLYSPGKESFIFAHSVKFFKAIMTLNEKDAELELEMMLNIDIQDSTIVSKSLIFANKLIYQNIFLKKTDGSLLFDIQNILREISSENTNKKFPYFLIIIIEALYLTNQTKLLLSLFDLIKKLNHLDFLFKNTRAAVLINHIIAYAFLKENQPDKALKLFHPELYRDLSLNYRFITRVHELLIEAEFLIYEGNNGLANEKLQQIIEISKFLGFTFFENKALSLLQNDLS